MLRQQQQPVAKNRHVLQRRERHACDNFGERLNTGKPALRTEPEQRILCGYNERVAEHIEAARPPQDAVADGRDRITEIIEHDEPVVIQDVYVVLLCEQYFQWAAELSAFRAEVTRGLEES